MPQTKKDRFVGLIFLIGWRGFNASAAAIALEAFHYFRIDLGNRPSVVDEADLRSSACRS
jgi:hypothetical protein